MRYLLMIYEREAEWAGMSEAEQGEIFGEYMAFTERLKAGGHYLGGNPLQPSSTATVVRVEGGKTLATDGPYAETREQLGGYYLVEAADLDQALSFAADIPSARHGMASIEVRPILEIPG
ncbi:MAG TPA: YciI family protein [Thermoanaerobaculia bacterium]|nr:YciI family protein [Thermoanaerobaculia bacterium]